MNRPQILILGAGNIGFAISELLLETGRYRILIGDRDARALGRLAERDDVNTVEVDCADAAGVKKAMSGCRAVVSALPFQMNLGVAQLALEAGVSYFDLTEDIDSTTQVRELAAGAVAGQVFMPQCGLAPGFIGILAHHLSQWFDEIESVKLRVGALPRYASNDLLYNLTWCTDGLINQYCRPCEAIRDGQRVQLQPLEGAEQLLIDGDRYEAFNTSGGLGTLCETLDGKVQELNYKTLRYVGHRDLMAFLIEGLRFGIGEQPHERQEALRELLVRSIPMTFQDVVVIFCTVTGMKHGRLMQISDARRICGQGIERSGGPRSAIQSTTAAAICAVLELHLTGRLGVQRGFVRQEDVDFRDFMSTDFGKHYETDDGHRLKSSNSPNGKANSRLLGQLV